MKTMKQIKQVTSLLVILALLGVLPLSGNAQKRRSGYETERPRQAVNVDSRKDHEKSGRSVKDAKVIINRHDSKPLYVRNPMVHRKPFYRHPEYGRVYFQLAGDPVVFRYSGGNLYYFDNHFYKYRIGIGYCEIELPTTVIFRKLPFACERVVIDGHVLLRRDNLFFDIHPRGYVIVPTPEKYRVKKVPVSIAEQVRSIK